MLRVLDLGWFDDSGTARTVGLGQCLTMNFSFSNICLTIDLLVSSFVVDWCALSGSQFSPPSRLRFPSRPLHLISFILTQLEHPHMTPFSQCDIANASSVFPGDAQNGEAGIGR